MSLIPSGIFHPSLFGPGHNLRHLKGEHYHGINEAVTGMTKRVQKCSITQYDKYIYSISKKSNKNLLKSKKNLQNEK